MRSTAPGATPSANPASARPTPTRGSRPIRSGGPGTDPRFRTCKEAFSEGYGPYHRGVHEEYAWYTDRDRDGVACDTEDMS
nr:hypothetical protein GCM10020093_110650 [Planobispora longispora]